MCLSFLFFIAVLLSACQRKYLIPLLVRGFARTTGVRVTSALSAWFSARLSGVRRQGTAVVFHLRRYRVPLRMPERSSCLGGGTRQSR